MNEIILSIIVVSVLLLVLTFLFYLTTKRVNILVKNIFVDKLQEYDFLIEDREKRVEELNTLIENKKSEESELVETLEKLKESIKSYEVSSDDVVISAKADFEDGNLLEEYKKIKNGFNFDYEKIVKEFLVNELKEENKNYETIKKIRGYFTHKVVYKISNFSASEQKNIVSELLNEDEIKAVNDLFKVKKFSVIKFINKLDDLITKNDPIIYIFVSDKHTNFNSLNKRIKTVYDEKITEGLRIEYRGKIYDYSI